MNQYCDTAIRWVWYAFGMGKPVSIEFLYRALITDSDGRVRTVHDRDHISITGNVPESGLVDFMNQSSLTFMREVARRVSATAAGIEGAGPPAADPAETAPRTVP